jgi:tetraacyldisaccharide 4'-kinase
MNGVLVSRIWNRETWWGKLLWVFLVPAAAMFWLLVWARNALFSLRWLRASPLDRPAVSIGNLTVGGSGKTPACIWLARALEKRGVKTAILSRGYGGKRRAPVVLAGARAAALASAEELAAAGDEPCMMAKIYGQTVAVCADRLLGARALLSETDVDLFILDDGFQHRRVKRDADLVLLGSDTSGWLLPAGPFREPLEALARADLLLFTASHPQWAERTRSWAEKPRFDAALVPVALVGYEENRWRTYPLSVLHRNKIIAVAGIAHPERFYRLLHELDGDLMDVLEFPDHHGYSAADWQRINRTGRAAELIVTTEKDIVKLARFPFPRGKLLALRVEMVVENGDALIAALSGMVGVPQSAVAI